MLPPITFPKRQVGMRLGNARDALVKNNLIIDTGKAAIYVTSKSAKGRRP